MLETCITIKPKAKQIGKENAQESHLSEYFNCFGPLKMFQTYKSSYIKFCIIVPVTENLLLFYVYQR